MNKNFKILLLSFFAILLCACQSDENLTYDIGVIGESNIQNTDKLTRIENSINSLGEGYTYASSIGKDQSSYLSSIDNFIAAEKDLIISTSFMQNPAVAAAASKNLETKFLVLDSILDPEIENTVSVHFKNNEAAFIAGYIAGLTTRSNLIGYVGPESSVIADEIEYGFKAGIRTAARELNKDIGIIVKHVESHADFDLGEELANEIYENGSDIIFESAGYTGDGVVESAINNSQYVISLGQDKSLISPANVLVSMYVDYETVVADLVNQVRNSSIESGKINYGYAQNAFRMNELSEESSLQNDILEKANLRIEEIASGDISVPYDSESYAD